jgi:hypothetical protein
MKAAFGVRLTALSRGLLVVKQIEVTAVDKCKENTIARHEILVCYYRIETIDSPMLSFIC